jgi:predicted nucleotidyltransferase component of viral defense system
VIKISIEEWVNQGKEIQQEPFRQSIHTILHAIANSQKLRDIMVIKGGVLIAICHHGGRFTKDVDFSTSKKLNEFKENDFLEEFKKQLSKSVNSLEYDLDCRLQSYETRPPRENATFPTLCLRVGYAYKGSREHRHLESGKSTKVIDIDFSFNEKINKIEQIKITETGDEYLQAYSLTDLIAEKFRAILQQEVRNRIRRQDPYDIYELINNYDLSEKDKKEILESLLVKSASRNLQVDQNSMDTPNIRNRCQKEYPNLANEIEGTLPPFDDLYSTVNRFYKSLPWE